MCGNWGNEVTPDEMGAGEGTVRTSSLALRVGVRAICVRWRMEVVYE